MTFYAFGINYVSSSVEQTEAFSFSPDAQARIYDRVSLSDDAEMVLLSTCNRTEVYLYGRSADRTRIQEALAAEAETPWPSDHTFALRDEAAVRHVLHVTSGLHSVVVGDAQILSQVKDAYQRAIDGNQVHSLMHRLMHTAFRAAKRVVHETNVSNGTASVSTAALAMADDFFANYGFNNLEAQDVLVLGAGKMGELALHALNNYQPASVTLTNRTHDTAQALADTHNINIVRWENRYAALADADVILVATGAPVHVLNAEDAPERTYKPLPAFVVDVAVPRNVDPSLNANDDYVVRDMDALEDWTTDVHSQRRAEIPKAKAICNELLSDFVTWVFHQQALQPAIQAIRHTFEGIRKQEVERHAHRVDGMDREEVDRLTQSIMQKLLAVPIVRLKNVDPDSIDFVHGIKLLHALFTRDEEATDRLPDRDDDDRPQLSDVPGSQTDERCPYEAASTPADSIRAILRSPHG